MSLISKFSLLLFCLVARKSGEKETSKLLMLLKTFRFFIVQNVEHALGGGPQKVSLSGSFCRGGKNFTNFLSIFFVFKNFPAYNETFKNIEKHNRREFFSFCIIFGEFRGKFLHSIYTPINFFFTFPFSCH